MGPNETRWYCEVDGERLSRVDVIVDGPRIIHVLDSSDGVVGHCTNQDAVTFQARKVDGLWRLDGPATYSQGEFGSLAMGPTRG
jgi:hypothetical protein